RRICRGGPAVYGLRRVRFPCRSPAISHITASLAQLLEPVAHNGLGRNSSPRRCANTARRSAMTMTGHPALVLNADFRPMSYFPLSLLCWEDAVHAVFSERVSVVAEYETWARSPSTKIRLPSVVALRKYQPIARRVAFTRFNVFLRDRF